MRDGALLILQSRHELEQLAQKDRIIGQEEIEQDQKQNGADKESVRASVKGLRVSRFCRTSTTGRFPGEPGREQ